MKAGILEIGDVYVVNKVDLGNEDVLVANLKFQLQTRDGWTPPIIRTAALEGRASTTLRPRSRSTHRTWTRAEGAANARSLGPGSKSSRTCSVSWSAASRRVALPGRAFDKLAEDVAARSARPHAAARKLLGSGPLRRGRPLARAEPLPIHGVEELLEPGHAVAPGGLQRGMSTWYPIVLKN